MNRASTGDVEQATCREGATLKVAMRRMGSDGVDAGRATGRGRLFGNRGARCLCSTVAGERMRSDRRAR